MVPPMNDTEIDAGAGMGDDKIHGRIAQERHYAMFLMGFAMGVTATLFLLMGLG